MSKRAGPGVRRMLRNTAAILSSTLGTKALNFIVIGVAARTVGLDAIGMVFFAEATAAVMLKAADFGFYQVLIRRTARGQATTRTLTQALQTRTLGLVGGLVLFAAAMGWLLPEQVVVLTGFFTARGLFLLHALGRALLVGQERFWLNASLAIASRTVGTAISVAGMLAGFGIEAWLAGALLAEIIQLSAVVYYAVAGVERTARESDLPLLREGFAFWIFVVLRLVTIHVTTVLVAALLGFAATSFFGVAKRVMQGGLLLVSALSLVAFPALARDRRRIITRGQATVVVGLALVIAFAVFLAAPVLVTIITGDQQPELVRALRVLTPAIGFSAVAQPLSIWLQAKDQERALVFVALAEAIVVTGLLLLLVPPYGVVGAAFALCLAAVVRLGGVSWTAHRVLRRAPADC